MIDRKATNISTSAAGPPFALKSGFPSASSSGNLVEYMQYHVDYTTSAALRAHGLPVSNYDGGVETWGRSVDDIML